MSDEFCAGVQILLKRMESNPDEFMGEFGKWSSIVNAVFSRKLGGDAIAIRSLTNAEAEALYERLVKVYRPEFDEYVMKNVLDEPEETLKYKATERYAQSWTDPRMAQGVKPGSIISVTAGGGGGSGGVLMQGGTGTTFVQGQLDAEPSPAFLQKIKKGLGL
jgi:hypothetical protein